MAKRSAPSGIPSAPPTTPPPPSPTEQELEDKAKAEAQSKMARIVAPARRLAQSGLLSLKPGMTENDRITFLPPAE